MTRRGHALNSEVRLITRVYGMLLGYSQVFQYYSTRFTTSSSSLPQPSQDRFTFPLIFEWKKQGNMPYATNFGDLCIVDRKAYISKSDSPGILEYNPDTDTWVDLPTLTKGHGMVSHNGKLTLVARRAGK